MTTDGIGVAATKLRAPAAPTRLIARTRLDDLLDDGVRSAVPLVLVSAPAGSGKSTLVASWATERSGSVAWLQIDDGDSDPAVFWSSLVAAVGRCQPELAAVVGPIVIGTQGDDRVVVPAMVNALDDGEPLVLVVDDYHLVDHTVVHRGMERLLDLCPPQLTVVLCTRVDPRVPPRGGCVSATGCARSAPTTCASRPTRPRRCSAPQAVDSRRRASTSSAREPRVGRPGWCSPGCPSNELSTRISFVDAFRGDDQLVVSYLGDELLATMGADDRSRLLETAVLDHLTGPLVDAVTGSTDGTAWLAGIANRNQLVIRLDTTGEWFRYHHLLHDLLVLEARRSFPDRVPELHGRAAAWFAANGDHGRAVAHQLAAGDVAGAMWSMRVVGPDLLGQGQVRTLRSLLDRIGPATAGDAVCALLWGWCEYLASGFAAAQHWLDRCTALAPPEFDPMISMPLRINVALGRGDVATALDNAQLVSIDELWHRPAELATAVGAAYTWAGRVTEARAALAVAVARSQVQQRFTANVLALISVAVNEAEHEAADAAHAAARDAIATAESFGLTAYHGVAPAFAIRARTAPEPDAARSDAAHALQLGRRATTDLGLAYVLTTCGDTLLGLGDADGAPLVVEARRLLDRCVDPGIAGRYLARTESRHHLQSVSPEPSVPQVEQLTDREIAVLRYLPSALSQRDISAELYVSLNTVKTHCGAIFRKLGVNDRKSAVQAARDLHLL